MNSDLSHGTYSTLCPWTFYPCPLFELCLTLNQCALIPKYDPIHWIIGLSGQCFFLRVVKMFFKICTQWPVRLLHVNFWDVQIEHVF